MRYEIEQAGAGREHEPDVGTHVEPAGWHVVKVSDAVPMPLTFDTLEQALAYVGRIPGTLRVVEVDDEGERLPVDSYLPLTAQDLARRRRQRRRKLAADDALREHVVERLEAGWSPQQIAGGARLQAGCDSRTFPQPAPNQSGRA
jgi:hypothetical protein